MSTQFENYSVSEINFIEPVGNDLGDLGAYSLTLTPDSGYELDANNFALTAPVPAGITNYSFNQAGPNVRFDFTFANGTIMPNNDIEFPLCIQGFANSLEFIIQGTVDIKTTNATPLSQIAPYSGSGEFGSTAIVYTQTILAANNHYFYVDPIAALMTGDSLNYNITSTKQYNGPNGELTSVTFSVEYTYPNQNVSGDLIRIVADAIPIVNIVPYVSGFTFDGLFGFSQPDVLPAGDNQTLILTGDPGAVFSVSFFENAGSGTETVYATNVTMPSSGNYTIPNVIFPSFSAGTPPYQVQISGDINPLIAIPGPDAHVDFNQYEQLNLTVSASTSNLDLSITGSPSVTPLILNNTYIPATTIDFEFKVFGDNMILTSAPDANSFSPVIPDPADPDFIYSLNSINTVLVPESLPVLEHYSITGQVLIDGTTAISKTHDLDIDNHIITISLPTIVTKGVSNETGTGADSGGESITDGGGTISSKGIQWSEFADFSTILGANDEGTGTADFTSSMTGLTTGNAYYVRAYAQNEAGIAYGQVIGFTPNITVPCSTTANSGGAGIQDLNINLDSGGGLIALLFEPAGVPDKMEIIHGGPAGTKVATSGFDNGTDGNSGPFDNAYGTEPSNTIPIPADVASTDQFIGTNKGVCPTRETQFTNETGYIADMGSYQQIVWWNYTAADWQTAPTVTVRITGSTGTAWSLLRLCCPDSNCTFAGTP